MIQWLSAAAIIYSVFETVFNWRRLHLVLLGVSRFYSTQSKTNGDTEKKTITYDTKSLWPQFVLPYLRLTGHSQYALFSKCALKNLHIIKLYIIKI